MKRKVTLALCITLSYFACRGRESAPAKRLAPAADRDFATKVAEVELYMKTHDVNNTPHDELARALAKFGNDFRALEKKAGADGELAGQCRLAAESMDLFVQSVSLPAGDPQAKALARKAFEKWRRVKAAARRKS